MRRIGTVGLGYAQTFVIIFGFLITSGLIFLFGIWVGRDVAERRLVQEERVVSAPILPPPTANEAAKHDVDQSFYEQLKGKAYQRLQETAAAASATAPPRSPVAGGGQLPIATVGTTPQVAQAAAPTRTAVQVVQKPTPKPTPPARVKAPETHGDEWADAGWTVQVNATTNPEQATDLAQRLKSKGYDAYTVQAPMRGQTWYRVRVGRFASRDKAKEIESRLKNTEGLENAYITPQ
jgi:cell division septation protein DedD